MTTRSLLDTELMYLTEEATSVATTVGAVDSTHYRGADQSGHPGRIHVSVTTQDCSGLRPPAAAYRTRAG